MLQRILAALATLITFTTGSKTREKALKDEIAARDVIIADLTKQLEDENADDASREAALDAANAAKEAAEKSLDDLNKQFATAADEAEKAVADISADPEIPLVVEADGSVRRTE